MNWLVNILIFLVVIVMGGAAAYQWGKNRMRSKFFQDINKGNEDATKTRNKVRTDSAYRDRIRKLFNGE